MSKKNLFNTAAVLTITLVCLSINCYVKAEHPSEHPRKPKEKGGLTKDQLADAIEAYIRKETAAHDGHFLITDEKTGKELRLTLVKVHREKLAKVGKNHYFACVDFKSSDNKVYDVDFFMKGSDKDNLTFSEFMIHKEDGKERYTWYEENGIWKRKPVAEQPKEKPKKDPNEHPKEHSSEHPG